MKRLDTRHIRRLLVRSTNWIGDAVMTTPALRAIRKNFPGAEIDLLAKPWVLPLFVESPLVDRCMVYDAGGRHCGWTGKLRLARDLRRERFDAAILLQNAFEAALIAWLAGIPQRIGFDADGRRLLLTHPVRRTAAIRRVHQTRYYPAILEGVGLQSDGSAPELTVGPLAAGRADALLARFDVSSEETLVGLNPGATYGPAKQWPAGRFARLADRLCDAHGVRILLFGGPGDRELGRTISGQMAHRPIDLSGRTRLDEAVALIGRCRLFITNDSGLMHVAAALNVPLLAIFGSTDPITTGPVGTASRVVRVPTPCSPCLRPECPEGHLSCMTRIDVPMVAAAAEEFL